VRSSRHPVLTQRSAKPKRRSIQERKEERELFFWTADKTLQTVRRALGLVIFAAIAAYVVITLAKGQFPGGTLLLRYL
jgi:hypothetical protein